LLRISLMATSVLPSFTSLHRTTVLKTPFPDDP
jgi:hypothetical protein